MYADEANFGQKSFDRQRDTGDQAAAADRDDDHFEIGILLVKLKSDCSLAGDDPGIVEGGNKSEALFLAQPLCFGVSAIVIIAAQHSFGAILAHARDFDQRCRSGITIVAAMFNRRL